MQLDNTNFVAPKKIIAIVETSKLLPGNIEQIDLPDLYDLLAEETVRFNRMLLQKAAKEDLNGLKNVIKKIQVEIHRRKGEALDDY